MQQTLKKAKNTKLKHGLFAHVEPSSTQDLIQSAHFQDGQPRFATKSACDQMKYGYKLPFGS